MLSGSAPRRIVLDETAFRRLVAGNAIHYSGGGRGVDIILADIGWTSMFRAILDGMTPPNPPNPPDPPEAREFLPRRHGKPGK